MWLALACSEAPPASATPNGEASAPSPLTDAPATLAQPSQLVPLARTISLCTPQPSSVLVEVDDGSERFAVDSVANSCHEVPLLGLRPDRDYAVDVSIDGRASQSLSFTTEPLPIDFPEFVVRAHDAAAVEPGVRWLTVTGKTERYAVAFDEALDVRWFHEDLGTMDLDWTDGTLLVQQTHDVQEIDLLGREMNRWSTSSSLLPGIGVPNLTFSHEAGRLPDGTMFALMRETRWIEGLRASYDDPGVRQDAWVEDNLLVRFDTAGVVLQSFGLFDRLDPEHLGYDALDVDAYGVDWLHANALQVATDASWWLTTLRHQDAVVMFDGSGDVSWILSPEFGWTGDFRDLLLTPIGPLEWPYHAHAAEWDPEDHTLLVFDNGNRRAMPGDGTTPVDPKDNLSRLVQFTVDPVARTIRQDWTYVEPQDGSLYAQMKGDIDRLPESGNVLGTYAYVTWRAGAKIVDRSSPSIRLIELAFTPDPVPVLDLELSSPDLSSTWESYRTELVAAPFPRAAP